MTMLIGCDAKKFGDSKNKDSQVAVVLTDEQKIIGNWKTEMDLADTINSLMASELGDAAEYLKIKEFKFIMNIEFEKNGTYKTTVDERSFSNSIENVKADFAVGITKMLEDLLEQEGIDMTVEELLTQQNTTIDAMVEEAFNKETFDEILDDNESAGKYKLDGKKLYTTDDLDDEFDYDEYETFELTNKKLKLLEYFGDLDTYDLYPMVFTKVD